MEKIAKFFIENAKLTVVLSLGLAFFGYQGLKNMNSESYPSVSFATAQVVTLYDGASANEIEAKITKPLEDEIRGVTGLKSVSSTSQAGVSKIIVRVDMDDPKVDVDDAMDEIQKAVDRVSDLPFDLQEAPEFTELKSEEFPVFEIAIVGSNEKRKRDLIADSLKDDFEDNRFVKEAVLRGYAEREFLVELDGKKLDRYHVSISEVMNKLGMRNRNIPGGPLRAEKTQKLVRVEGKIQSVEDIENIAIRSDYSGPIIFLKDLGRVSDYEEEITMKNRHNGEEATLIVVNKKGGADTIDMVTQLEETLGEYQKRYPDFNFHVYHTEKKNVQDRVDVLVSNALTGLFFVILFLFIFLPGRIGLMASFSLPLAMAGTLGIMPLFGMNIDAISVLALIIALGMMVDNSVVISENFTRLVDEGYSPLEAAMDSIRSLWLPITATAFTTIAAFLPMLVTKGVMGEFIKNIPIVVTIALLLSLVESFFFLPMRLVWSFTGKQMSEENNGSKKRGVFSYFQEKFENHMRFLVKWRYFTAVIFTGLLSFSLFMMIKANKFILFPAEQTEIYIGRLEMPNGTRLETTSKTMGDISREIKKVLGDDVIDVVAMAGVSQVGPGDPKEREGNSVGVFIIYVSENAKQNIAYTEILNRLKVIRPKEVKSLTFEEQINGPPVGNAIEATFRANSPQKIDRMISLIKGELEKVPGVENLQVNDIIGDDEVFVEIDYEKADRLGLNVASIGSMIRTAISGTRASDVTLLNKEVHIKVRLKSGQRKSVEDLKKLKIRDPRGNLLPLSSFANFRLERGAPVVKRYDFKKSKTLLGDVDTTKITSIKANRILLDSFNRYRTEVPGVSVVFGGAQESTKDSLTSLFEALNLSLIGIFALMVFLFRSYLRPMIIMTTIPLGLLGFSVAFYFHQRPVSFLALIGVIGLGGIIVNSGIVLISFIDEMREKGDLPLREILVKASGMRLRAVLVTSLTTISGLFPTAYGIGGNDAMLIPMTLAMAWGLTSGTILTLVWVPAAYAILEDWGSLLRKIFGFFTPSQRKSS